jgi:MFS family permease
MFKVLKNSWALFTGIGIVMIAHGLQGNLMGVRAVIENFNVVTTGIFMSGYYVGYFLGSYTAPKLVAKVGHIRVFAAFASMASLSVLIVAVFVNPLVWTFARFITGISLVSCYIVAESWLNDRATNRTRGKILSAYMITLFIGLGIGMLLLNFDSPKNYEPFILVSLLLSISLIPILLTKRPAPKFKKIGTIKIKQLYNISPLGVVSSFCTGVIHSVLFSLAAVYAAIIKFTVFEISLLLFLVTLSGVFTQGPIGYLSDKFDRRLVIVLTALGGGFFSILAIIVSGESLQVMYLASNWGLNKSLFFVAVALYSSLALPLFSLNLAHTNDLFLRKNLLQLVVACS